MGFSTWALQAGDRAAIRLLREVAAAIEPPIAERRFSAKGTPSELTAYALTRSGV